MMTTRLPFLACLSLLGVASVLLCDQAEANNEEGSLYVDGALVHFIKADERRHAEPVIMIPGMNLSSYIYLTTPDGRPGWAQKFADAGYDVYVVNDPSFDFSRGFGVVGFENVPSEGAPPADPSAQQGWQQDIWSRWGFGESEGSPYEDTRFPTEDFAEFEANYPYLSSSKGNFAGAIGSLLDMVGPSILMPHSAAGPQALNAALAKPEKVKGFVLVEPTGPPTADDFPALAGKFMLGIYGDYIASRRQTGRQAAVKDAAVLFSENGGPAQVVSLPDDLGVKGNTHLLMQDDNNAQIADLIIGWLAEPVDKPGEGGGEASGGGRRGRGGMTGGGAGGSGGRGGGRGASMGAAIFAQLDTDGSKTISETEFGKSRRMAQAGAEAAKKAFQEADADGDGSLDEAELGKVLSGVGAGGRGGRGGKGGAR